MFLVLLLMKSLFSNIIYNLQEYVQIYESDFKNKKNILQVQALL